MHKDIARVIGAGLVGGAFAWNAMNIFTYGENPDGILTFLYIATALAIIASIFIFAAYKREIIIIRYKMIGIIFVTIINIIFLIPSI